MHFVYTQGTFKVTFADPGEPPPPNCVRYLHGTAVVTLPPGATPDGATRTVTATITF